MPKKNTFSRDKILIFLFFFIKDCFNSWFSQKRESNNNNDPRQIECNVHLYTKIPMKLKNKRGPSSSSSLLTSGVCVCFRVGIIE